jgi:hypothetical protein
MHTDNATLGIVGAMSSEVTSLPSTGPERKIFLAALRTFSDTCEPPQTLHSDCPYAISFNGQRRCGEECSDLLAEHDDPISNIGFVLGDGINAIPRGPRRLRSGPSPSDTPFDASKILAREISLPDSQKSMTSLLAGLISNCVTNHLSEVKQSSITSSSFSILFELDHRGIDTLELISEIIIPSISSMIVIRILIALEESPVMPDSDRVKALKGWGEFISQHVSKTKNPDGSGDASTIFLMEIQPKLRSWLQQLELEDLFGGLEYEVEDILSQHGAEDIRDAKMRWIFDRFCTTYLEDWRDDSLHQEWRYLRGELVAPCENFQMESRRIEGNRLSTVIANRATNLKQTHGALVSPSQYVTKALEFLSRGEWVAATAIFDVICKVNPLSGEAYNNRGFCELPFRPNDALRDFDRANDLGREGFANTSANKVYALFLLERMSSALEVANSWWERDKKIDTSSWMWDFHNSEFTIVWVESCSVYLAELAIHICEQVGDNVAKGMWKSRI